MRPIDVRDLTGKALKGYLVHKLKEWEGSEAKKMAFAGVDYYKGRQKIDEKQRLGVDDAGRLVTLRGLPNTIIKDNKYALLVDQKVNYILSEQPAITCDDNDQYATALSDFVDRRFLRTWIKIAKDAMNCAIGWLYLYIEDGRLRYRKIDARYIIPVWEDVEHESLQALIRIRDDQDWNADREDMTYTRYVEFYTDNGVQIFKYEDADMQFIEAQAYMYTGELKPADDEAEAQGFNWGKIPFIYFRYNAEEISLLSRVKTLQDNINLILSTFGDQMQEDSRNTILVIRGYDGEDPREVRGEMNRTGVLQLSEDGSVDPLNIEVNAANFQVYLQLLKEKLIENGRGLDMRQERSGNAPNEMNIKSMYADIELDAAGMELEWQASFEHLQYFFKLATYGTSRPDLLADIAFKRNMMVNEESAIRMLTASSGLLSRRTQLEHHPLVDDVDQEEERLDKEQAQEVADYLSAFPLAPKAVNPTDDPSLLAPTRRAAGASPEQGE
ncbi:phage portal protein [Peptococcus simiae]|uniref:phage portal protein n=1 Tax=Peptococcus simiae TaxID=1643805 RepID=UPI00397F3FFB